MSDAFDDFFADAADGSNGGDGRDDDNDDDDDDDDDDSADRCGGLGAGENSSGEEAAARAGVGDYRDDDDAFVASPRRGQCAAARQPGARQFTDMGWTLITGGANVPASQAAAFIQKYGEQHAPGRGYSRCGSNKRADRGKKRVFLYKCLFQGCPHQVKCEVRMNTPPRPRVCGVWCVVCGVWCVVCGGWSVECGVWSVECGVWSVECGVWSVECGGWRAGAVS